MRIGSRHEAGCSSLTVDLGIEEPNLRPGGAGHGEGVHEARAFIELVSQFFRTLLDLVEFGKASHRAHQRRIDTQ